MMGRLVGTGSTVAILTLVGLFMGLGAYFLADVYSSDSEVTAAEDSSAAVHETADPACFWPVLDAAFSPDAPDAPVSVPFRGCAPQGAEIEVDGDWTRVTLQTGEPGDADFERRSSGIKVALVVDNGALVLEAYDNWGGSGVFSSLIIGRVASPDALTQIRTYAFGDRCNGGVAGTRVEPNGRLIANANMTPWDIMIEPFADLPFETQWEAGKARFGAAFGQASSCAICCSAVTREYGPDDQGDLVPVGLRYEPGAAPSSEDRLTVCLEDAVRQAAGADGLVEADEQAFLGTLIDACAKDAEN
jgi:hypothetical protein